MPPAITPPPRRLAEVAPVSKAAIVLDFVQGVGPTYFGVVQEAMQLQRELEHEKTQRLAIRKESQIRLEELRGRLRQMDEIIAGDRDLQEKIHEHVKLLIESGDHEGGRLLSARLMEFRLQAVGKLIEYRNRNVSAGYIQITAKEEK